MSITQPSSATPSTGPGRYRRLLTRASAASAICAALVAATVSTATPSQASTASASAVTLTQQPSMAQAVLSLLNQERWAHGLPAISMNTKLISSAYNHNVVMAKQNTMSHQCAGEAPLGDRIDKVKYDWSTAGENIGWNSDMSAAGANALEVVMYNEKAPNDGHRQIILSRAYRNVGISVVTDTTHHKLWLTADFGHLMS